MKPTHPVELLACAIATQEGGWFVPGSLPQLRNNPGDIRYDGQLNAGCPRCGAVAPEVPRQCSNLAGDVFEVHDIATCASKAAGVTLLFRQLWLQVAEGQTVRQIIDQWARQHRKTTPRHIFRMC
jgi:hypothetical protein